MNDGKWFFLFLMVLVVCGAAVGVADKLAPKQCPAVEAAK